MYIYQSIFIWYTSHSWNLQRDCQIQNSGSRFIRIIVFTCIAHACNSIQLLMLWRKKSKPHRNLILYLAKHIIRNKFRIWSHELSILMFREIFWIVIVRWETVRNHISGIGSQTTCLLRFVLCYSKKINLKFKFWIIAKWF